MKTEVETANNLIRVSGGANAEQVATILAAKLNMQVAPAPAVHVEEALELPTTEEPEKARPFVSVAPPGIEEAMPLPSATA